MSKVYDSGSQRLSSRTKWLLIIAPLGAIATAFALVLLGWSLGASEPSHVFIEREVIREVPAAPVSLVVHDIKIERMLFQQAWEAIDERRWQRAEALCDEAQRDYFLPTCTEIRALAAEGLGERERACTLFERAHSERAIQLQAFAAYTERARCAEWHIGPSGTLAQSILDEKVSKARQRMFKGDYQGALDLCEAIESPSNCDLIAGIAHERLGHTRKACARFSAALMFGKGENASAIRTKMEKLSCEIPALAYD